jgi:general secretion pathway protein A
MLLDYYGLREQPFGVTPDPAYLYLSRTHSEALDSLSKGIMSDRGFMAIIAKPGMGKTTLLYHLLEQLRDSACTAFLFQTQCTSHEFFGYLLNELGIGTPGMDLVTMHDRLNKVLFNEMLAGKRFVLVVDEAQNLNESVLETIRLLSNFETPHAKLLQIVLAGQPQLAEKLARPSLSQLRQRIATLCCLDALSAEETTRYIHHRLRVAGYSGDPIFTTDALAMIAEQSDGIPRNINNLCFNAMSWACARELKIVGPAAVQEAVAGLNVASIVGRSYADEPSSGASPQLTYQPHEHSAVWRRVSGGLALSTMLFAGALALLPSLGKLGGSTQSGMTRMSVEQAVDPTLPENSAISRIQFSPAIHAASGSMGSDPASQGIASLQFLIIAAGPQETLRGISLRYLGRFDQKLFDQICALNPELKNPTLIEAGQLIRLPLPPGTLKKGYDTAALDGVPKNAPAN